MNYWNTGAEWILKQFDNGQPLSTVLVGVVIVGAWFAVELWLDGIHQSRKGGEEK